MEGGPLRRLFLRTGLKSINERPGMFAYEADDEDEQASDKLFLSHAELGRENRRAVKEKANCRARWTGMRTSCEYHEPLWVADSRLEEVDIFEGQCAFVDEDCYLLRPCQSVRHIRSKRRIEHWRGRWTLEMSHQSRLLRRSHQQRYRKRT